MTAGDKTLLAYVGAGLLLGLTLTLAFVSPNAPSRSRAEQPTAVAPAPTQQQTPSSHSDRPAAQAPTPITTPKVAPPPDLNSDPRVERAVREDVPDVVYSASATCYGGQEGKDEVIELKYKIIFDGENGYLSDVELLRSEFDDPELESCIVEALSGLTWPDAETPPANREGIAAIPMLSLQTRYRYLVPSEPVE